MDDAQPQEALSTLNEVEEICNAHNVTTHEHQRMDADGEVQQVTVKVYDAGPEEESAMRFHAEAYAEGKVARGLCYARAEEAVTAIRWKEYGG